MRYAIELVACLGMVLPTGDAPASEARPFDGGAGTGARVEGRPCTFQFEKR